jgi:hypothetical protein
MLTYMLRPSRQITVQTLLIFAPFGSVAFAGAIKWSGSGLSLGGAPKAQKNYRLGWSAAQPQECLTIDQALKERQVVLLFKDFSEAASTGWRCSQRDLNTLTSRWSEARGLASSV